MNTGTIATARNTQRNASEVVFWISCVPIITPTLVFFAPSKLTSFLTFWYTFSELVALEAIVAKANIWRHTASILARHLTSWFTSATESTISVCLFFFFFTFSRSKVYYLQKVINFVIAGITLARFWRHASSVHTLLLAQRKTIIAVSIVFFTAHLPLSDFEFQLQ